MTMLSNINVLDCTLRDGGYVNNWDFGNITIKSIVNGLVKSGIDIVEVGFLRDCVYDANKTLFNNITEVKRIIPEYHGKTKFSLMVLHDKYTLDKLEDNDGSIDIVRVTFHNYDIDEGLEYVRRLMGKGYNVFINPINIMGYSDGDLFHLIEKINVIEPFGVSVVDTFGSMRFRDFVKIYSIFESNVDKDICIGLHLHENLSMAFSLAQKFIHDLPPRRNAVIDASLFGMGRVPGNLCIELLVDYINDHLGRNRYDINPILDLIDNHILRMKTETNWGYSPPYLLSARYNLHRNYSEFLLDKGRLSTKGINDILSGIPREKKAAFDADYAEQIYSDYQRHAIDDTEIINQLKDQINGRDVLILAPGSSLATQKEKIDAFIFKNKPYIFSANFAPVDFNADKYFFSNEKRLAIFEENAVSEKLLITSNIRRGEIDKINYNNLSNSPVKSEVSVPILFNLLYELGLKTVYIAGFDGFEKEQPSFFDSSLEFIGVHGSDADKSNTEMMDILNQFSGKLDIRFITKSRYQEG